MLPRRERVPRDQMARAGHACREVERSDAWEALRTKAGARARRCPCAAAPPRVRRARWARPSRAATVRRKSAREVLCEARREKMRVVMCHGNAAIIPLMTPPHHDHYQAFISHHTSSLMRPPPDTFICSRCRHLYPPSIARRKRLQA